MPSVYDQVEIDVASPSPRYTWLNPEAVKWALGELGVVAPESGEFTVQVDREVLLAKLFEWSRRNHA